MNPRIFSIARLEQVFESSIQKTDWFKPGLEIWIACSGGPDSVALVHLLESLRKKYRLRLGLLHFNHRLRPKESIKDEAFARSLAKCLSLPIKIGRAKLVFRAKLSPEEAARECRYDYFKQFVKARKKKTWIATAHTINDQAETILMRMLQGTGLQGLCGIRGLVKSGQAIFVRPLLEIGRPAIFDYLKSRKLCYRIDTSNRSRRFLRNRIRLDVLPRLCKEINPRGIEALARIPAIIQEESWALSQFEERAWKEIFVKGRKGSRVILKRREWSQLPGAIQFRILQRGLKWTHAASGLSYDRWGYLRGHLARPGFRCSLPKDIELELTPSTLSIYKKSSKVVLNR